MAAIERNWGKGYGALQARRYTIASAGSSGFFHRRGFSDWNTTATAVVCSDHDEIWVADLLGAHTRIRFGGHFEMPTWSPLGDKVLFSDNWGVSTVKPNGLGYKVILRHIWNSHRGRDFLRHRAPVPDPPSSTAIAS